MNLQQMANGEFLHAYYIEYDEDKKEYKPRKRFRYKTYDDTQYRESRYSPQAGHDTTKSTVSIETSAPYDFKTYDKVYLVNNDVTLTITAVEERQNTPFAMTNLVLPGMRKTSPKRLHLNKDDV